MPVRFFYWDRLVSRLEPTLEPTREVRRIEVITGAGGRRRWTGDDKARILAETLEPGAVVSAIARRHGLTPRQLFAWRREARKQSGAVESAPPKFVPAVVEPEPAKRRRRASAAAAIEVEIDGVTVWIGEGAKAVTVAAVIRALKGAV
jgi:transposase